MLLGWSVGQKFLLVEFGHCFALCKTKACRRTLHVIAGSAQMNYYLRSNLMSYITSPNNFNKTKPLPMLIDFKSEDIQYDDCNSRFPGCPQAASLPVGHVTGRHLLAGHIP